MKTKWKKEKLGNILLRKKDTVRIDNTKEYSRLTIKMNGGGILIRDTISGDRIGTKNQFLVKEGQLLLSKIDARNGAFGVVPKEADGAIITGNFWAYEVNKKLLDKSFFEYLSRTDKFLEFCINSSQGATNRKYLQEHIFLAREIELPPLLEQKRIVKRIKEIEEKVKFVELNRKKSIEYQSSFYETSLSKLFKKFNFKYEIFSEVVDFRRGPFGGSLKKGIFVESGPKVYEQKNAIYNDFTLGKYFVTEEKYKEMEMFAIKPGDLIVSCSGTIGKIAIVPDNAQKGIINQALLKITPNREKILARFLELILENPDFGDQIFIKVRGSAMKNIGALKYIKKLKIPLPNIKTQQEIISIASKLKEFLSILNKETIKNEKIISALIPSVLAKAFNGDL